MVRRSRAFTVYRDTTEILEESKDNAQSYLNKSEEHGFISLQFRTSALDLLVTERYIEATEPFYHLLEKALRRFLAYNSVFQDREMKLDPMRNEKFINFHPIVKAELDTISEGSIKLRAALIIKS